MESAWTANSAVIVENAVPIRIERPSRARAPATLSSSDASDVSAAAPPTNPKCWFGVSFAGSLPTSATSTMGAIETTSAKRDDEPGPGHCSGVSARGRGKLSRGEVVLTNT